MSQCATVTALPTGPRPTPVSEPKPKCLGDDLNKFFPHEPPAEYPTARAGYEAKARHLCAGCPLAVQCLTDELKRMTGDDSATWGVLGGTAPWERQRILRDSQSGGYDLDEAVIRFHEQQEAVA